MSSHSPYGICTIHWIWLELKWTRVNYNPQFAQQVEHEIHFHSPPLTSISGCGTRSCPRTLVQPDLTGDKVAAQRPKRRKVALICSLTSVARYQGRCENEEWDLEATFNQIQTLEVFERLPKEQNAGGPNWKAFLKTGLTHRAVEGLLRAENTESKNNCQQN